MNKMKIATFNANSIRARLEIVLNWLEKEKPDALCVQETKSQDQDFPAEAFESAGWRARFYGQKSYNGVAIITREPLEGVSAGLRDGAEETEQARLITGMLGGVAIVNTYVPQGFEVGSEKFQYKLEWLARLRAWFERNFNPEQPIVWVGDFNVAPEPKDVYDPVKLAGHVCFHPDEQAALARIAEWGFVDVFRKHVPEEGKYTFWDYRQNSFKRNIGWRIDHIMATAPMAEKSTGAYIDAEPRKLPQPSDHTFLVAEFDAG